MESYSKENLIEFLKYLTNEIESGNIDSFTCEQVWNSLFWDAKDPQNKKMMNYLIIGKIIKDNFAI